MNITITFSATPELLSILQGLAGLFPTPAKENKPDKKANNLSVVKSDPITPLADIPAGDTIAGAGDSTVSANTEDALAVTIEQLRKAVTEKSQKGKKEACKKLLNEFGVAKVTELAPETYSSFLGKVNAL